MGPLGDPEAGGLPTLRTGVSNSTYTAISPLDPNVLLEACLKARDSKFILKSL